MGEICIWPYLHVYYYCTALTLLDVGVWSVAILGDWRLRAVLDEMRCFLYLLAALFSKRRRNLRLGSAKCLLNGEKLCHVLVPMA